MREREERKKDEQIKIFMFGCLDLVKRQWNLQSRFSNRTPKGRKSVRLLIPQLCFSGSYSDVPYVHAAILNLLDPYLMSTTVLLDICMCSGRGYCACLVDANEDCYTANYFCTIRRINQFFWCHVGIQQT